MSWLDSKFHTCNLTKTKFIKLTINKGGLVDYKEHFALFNKTFFKFPVQ